MSNRTSNKKIKAIIVDVYENAFDQAVKFVNKELCAEYPSVRGGSSFCSFELPEKRLH